MPINNSSFVQCALELNEEFKKKKLIENILVKIIYDCITRRSSQEISLNAFNSFFKKKENAYFNTLRSLKFDKTAIITSKGMWHQIDSRSLTKKFHKENIGKYEITHKDYFSFFPTSKDNKIIYQEMINFLRILPELHKRLYQISLAEGDEIIFKVPFHIYTLIKHTDSLVVYYSNKKNNKKIRRVVVGLFKEKGLLVKRRKFRSNHGFDFSDVVDHVSGGSHSDLVAKVLAKIIINDKKFKLKSLDETIIWLKTSVKEVCTWDIKKIYSFLYKK